jgi:hypothetical protein
LPGRKKKKKKRRNLCVQQPTPGTILSNNYWALEMPFDYMIAHLLRAFNASLPRQRLFFSFLFFFFFFSLIVSPTASLRRVMKDGLTER